uniref:TNF receptor superfamily member 19 n=1 Tax=Ailuropoda melanoleuca TaxID=9646 RepID=A0A7N5KQJ1_AILME
WALRKVSEQDSHEFKKKKKKSSHSGNACEVICETGDCRQQEFRDRSGNCVLCKQCGPGMELSKECGFGYGEDAQCMACRPHRFKEDWGFQKCKPCLECAAVNRFQKANCSVTSDAICGDCLPGYVGPFLSLVIREFFFNRRPTELEEQFINHICDKGLSYLEYIKNSYNSIMKRPITQLKYGQRI